MVSFIISCTIPCVQLLSVASFAETCALALKQEPLDDESCDLTARPLVCKAFSTVDELIDC